MLRPAPSRNLWPLGVALGLVVFAGGLVALIVLAVSSNSDLVMEDYYEQEIRYSEQLERLARAEAIDGAVEVRYDAGLGVLILTFPEVQAARGISGEVHLYRPSAAGMDRKLPLSLNAAGMQVIPAADLAPGLWQVRIRWVVEGEDYYVEQRLILPKEAA
jgi:nitrogen fixation protein FixH